MKNQKGSNNPNWKGGKVKHICPTCDKVFYTFPSRHQIHCSEKCRPKTGRHNPKWHGGYLICGGYKYLYRPNHPNATKTGYVLEHRLIIEAFFGRLLKKTEVVHHINHNKLDNHPTNLMVFSSTGKHYISSHFSKRNSKGQFV